MFRGIVVFIGGLALLSASTLSAQNAALGQKYGSGVHAYFAGDYAQAYEQLTAAVNAGSRDPRVFYFRGLADLKLGRGPEAAQDFSKGAALESRDANKFYNVSKALERVQGAPRVELEKYRVDARMAVFEANERYRKARYEAIHREEKRVMRPMPPAPLEPLITPEPIATPTSDAADDVFAAPAGEKSAPKAAASPAPEAKKAQPRCPPRNRQPRPKSPQPKKNRRPKRTPKPIPSLSDLLLVS